MPLIENTHQQPTERDDLDELFDLDASIEDAFNDSNTGDDPTRNGQPSSRPRERNGGADLGIDAPINITKQRRPVAKLDDESPRLLSSAGIPKLRKITKDRLKFRGKGHEFSDVSRLLNLYQLWLDDLFPRANFADGLAIIEKLGHSKRMQMLRKEWIEEGKPKPHYEALSEGTEGVDRGTAFDARPGSGSPMRAHEGLDAHDAGTQSFQSDPGLHDKNDEPKDPAGSADPAEPGNATRDAGKVLADTEVEDDELDALLAEDAERAAAGEQGSLSESFAWNPPRDIFEDEMEVMRDVGDAW
ncbi:MAG: chromosome segregation in meiosis- protein [Bogoriella megaspora]|nr:MAG: chromosome segregation in meiosis- protein [Bogoriella megaspora]